MREGQCRCGQLKVSCEGEPVRISVCHCLNCQRRSGSAFSAQARWPEAQVTITGEAKEFVTSDSDSGSSASFHFCGRCGSTVYYYIEAMPGLIAVPIGAFADPTFPAPTFSVFEDRMHMWTGVLGPDVEHWP